MGSCFSISSSAASRRPPTAKVIKPDGSFTEYSAPVEVVHVLGANHLQYFLCDAEGLFYGDKFQALDTNHLIRLGNIYFLLPIERLRYPLTAVEMAVLAARVKAAFSKAVFAETEKKARRILPVAAAEFDGCERFNEDTVAGPTLIRRSSTRNQVPPVGSVSKGVKKNRYGGSRRRVQILPVIVEEFDGFE